MAHRQRVKAGEAGASGQGGPGDEKTCAVCGRRMEWRTKWAANWSEVRYCSDACRTHGIADVDRQLEATILELLAARAATSTICPSDAARAVGEENSWRDLMEPARQAARRLVAAGEVEITQGGSVVDPSTAKGPIRIRRRRP
jgi:hypothetical protein